MLIGLAGKAGCGKDEVAKHLVMNHHFMRYAFADPIKQLVNPMFGWDERHSFGKLKEVADPAWGFSPRQAYQLFGTEFARALRHDFWIHWASKVVGQYADAGFDVVIPDVRFDNEAEWIRTHGVIIHIDRPGIAPVNAHVSEAGITKLDGDLTIENDDSLEELYNTVEWTLETIKKGKAE